MQHCQHPLPLTMSTYEALPDDDGIIPDPAMDAFECGRPAGIKHEGMWLCVDHYDARCRGKRLIQERSDACDVRHRRMHATFLSPAQYSNTVGRDPENVTGVVEEI